MLLVVFSGEKSINKIKDYFTDSQFSDGKHSWNVEDIYDFAKKNGKPEEIPVSKLKANREYWQGNKDRMMNADTKYPILIIAEPEGFLSVADGLNRLEKIITIEKKDTIPAYLVNKKDIIDLAV